MGTKTCKTCLVDKEISEFHKQRVMCKTCVNLQSKEYRQKNAEKVKEHDRQRGRLKRRSKVKICATCATTLEPVSKKIYCPVCLMDRKKQYVKKPQCRKTYYAENKERIKNSIKKYRENNKEKVKQKAKLKYRKNIESYLEYHKRYRENNKEKIQKRRREYEEKNKNNTKLKLRRRIRCSVRCALLRNNHKKDGSILSKLPYSIEELKKHLESKFESWMNWDNWGVYNPTSWDDNDPKTWVWQIDHIIPQSRFNYTSMDGEEFRACWSLDNLRPYSAKLNISEGDKR